jgi:hypothetical protein
VQPGTLRVAGLFNVVGKRIFRSGGRFHQLLLDHGNDNIPDVPAANAQQGQANDPLDDEHPPVALLAAD